MLDSLLSTSGETVIASAPEGIDALVLSRLAKLRAAGTEAAQGPASLLHVARDDARMARLAALLAFYDPDLEVLQFPAWDCLPYDRVSPHRNVLAQRIDTLCRLAEGPVERPRLLITTVNAFLQRVPPAEHFAARRLQARVGESLAPDAVIGFFAANGYLRSDTVGEPGEFAVRGGLIDVFPPGAEQPLRLDCLRR